MTIVSCLPLTGGSAASVGILPNDHIHPTHSDCSRHDAGRQLRRPGRGRAGMARHQQAGVQVSTLALSRPIDQLRASLPCLSVSFAQAKSIGGPRLEVELTCQRADRWQRRAWADCLIGCSTHVQGPAGQDGHPPRRQPLGQDPPELSYVSQVDLISSRICRGEG